MMATTDIHTSRTSTALQMVSNDGLVDMKPFGYLCNNQKFADIEFIVEKELQQRISAHKVILSVRSAVFEAMFFGSLATKSDEIEIPDVEPAAFLRLLKFFYSNEIQICPESVMATLYVANKYDVPSFGSYFEKPQLVALCLDIIDKNTMDVLDADTFTNIDLGTLIFVLERKTLQAFESKLFQAIVLWSKAECARKQLPVTLENQRSVLGGAFKLIRFSLMTSREFLIGPVQSGLLGHDEVIKFSKDVASNMNYMEIPRCSKTSLECHLKFKSSGSTSSYISKARTCFTDHFKVNRSVVIVGIVLLPSIIKYVYVPVSARSQISIMLRIIFNRPIMAIPDNGYKIEIQVEEFSDTDNCKTIPTNGIICGNDGPCLENMKSSDYFTFESFSGIITEIIFYD